MHKAIECLPHPKLALCSVLMSCPANWSGLPQRALESRGREVIHSCSHRALQSHRNTLLWSPSRLNWLQGEGRDYRYTSNFTVVSWKRAHYGLSRTKDLAGFDDNFQNWQNSLWMSWSWYLKVLLCMCNLLGDQNSIMQTKHRTCTSHHQQNLNTGDHITSMLEMPYRASNSKAVRLGKL